MSKLRRLLGVLSIVSLFAFSSCVDDEVSPEVTALRNAQVALLNANTSVEAATAALINANVQAQTIANTFASANNAIILQLAALDVELKATEVAAAEANLEVALAAAETALAAEALKLAQAADALELYVSTAGLVQAAQYLADWNAVMFGGVVSADKGAFLTGIVDVRSEIAQLETQIAKAKVFTSTMDGAEKRAFVTASLTAAVAAAQTEITERTARLATVKALLAGDFADPAAAQKAQLIELAEEKQALENEIEDLEAEIDALYASTDEADAIIENFENDVQGGSDYLQAITDEGDADDLIEENAEILAAWDEYAAGLQAIYDEYHPFVAEAETEIAELEAEIEAAAPEGGATLEQVRDLETAFRNAVAAEILMKVKRANENAATADTTAYLTARAAYDGLSTRDQLFEAATFPGGAREMIGARELTYVDGDATDYTDYFTEGDAADNRSGNGDDEVGGALGDVFKANVNTPTDVLAQQIKLVQLQNGFSSQIDDLAEMKTFIANITSRKQAFNGLFWFCNDCDMANDDFNNEWYDGFEAALAELEGEGDLSFDKSPKSASTDRAAAVKAKATAAAAKAKWAPFVAPYLAAYEEALELDSDKLDSLAIGPRFELYGLELQIADIESTIVDVKADIARADQSVSVFELNDDNDPEVVNLRDAYLAEADELGGSADVDGSIKQSEAEFREATNDLERHAIDEIETNALIARDEAELAALKTELTVLQALLAKYQALVLAAIG